MVVEDEIITDGRTRTEDDGSPHPEKKNKDKEERVNPSSIISTIA